MQFGNLLGAAANLTTAFGKDKSLKSYLEHINDFGIQVANNFEVNFDGLEDITFFVTDVNFASVKMDFETIYYNGRSVQIPIGVYDYEHTGSMTIINDGCGYIYAAITNFLMAEGPTLVQSGHTMTIKCLTGDDKYKGATITLNNVVLESVDGLSFGYSSNDVQTFNVSFQYLDFTFTPGALATAAGVVGAVNKLIS